MIALKVIETALYQINPTECLGHVRDSVRSISFQILQQKALLTQNTYTKKYTRTKAKQTH